MKKILATHLVILFLTLLAGCSGFEYASNLNSKTPTATLSVTETSEYVTPVGNITTTATPFTIKTKQNVCLDVSLTTQFELPSERLVLTDGRNLEFLIPKIKQNDEFFKPNESISFPIISPQGNWLAFKQTINFDTTQKGPRAQLMIVSSDEKTAKQMEWDNNWASLGYWMDEENIVVKISRNPPSTLNSLLILNIETGTTRILSPNFPGIEDLTRLLWSNSGKTIYNSSVTEVIYPTLGENGRAYILWDIINEKAIVSLSTRDFSQDGPHWSYKNNGFAIVATGDPNLLGKNEFFWVSETGKILQVTSFRDEYTSIDIRKWSWSPNGQYIAFWYQVGYLESKNLNQIYSLGLLDLASGKTVNYCITSLLNFLQEPLWSPDSSVVALNLTSEKDKENQVVLLNIQKHATLLIDKNKIPVGWLSMDIGN